MQRYTDKFICWFRTGTDASVAPVAFVRSAQMLHDGVRLSG